MILPFVLGGLGLAGIWWAFVRKPKAEETPAARGGTHPATHADAPIKPVSMKTSMPAERKDWTEFDFDGKRYAVAPRAIGPLALGEAKRIVKDNGWTFPTRKMVDAIWSLADMKVLPAPQSHDGTLKTMMGEKAIQGMRDAVERQIGGRAFQLLAGDSKLIVSENGKIGIYGWFVPTDREAEWKKQYGGIPLHAPVTPNLGAKIIQQYPSPHDDSWGDYSQYLYPVVEVGMQA